MNDYENPWTFESTIVNSEILETYCGFVYLITNSITGKMYIGKKMLTFKKTKTVKKKKKKFVVESDWKDYYGSNAELNELVEKQGKHNFKREILRLCKSRAECSYYEAREQFIRDVLLKPEYYYNSWISCRTRREHLKKLI